MSEPAVEPIAPTGRRATTRDVAAAAGVSRTTVSEIFNGRADRFPTPTVERVRDAADAMRYRPSPAARTLVTGRSHTALVVLPTLTTPPGFDQIIDAISTALTPRGLHTVTQFAVGGSGDLVDEIVSLGPAGVIDFGALTGAARAALREVGIAVTPEVDEQGVVAFQAEIGRAMYQRLATRDPARLLYVSSPSAASSPYDAVRFRAIERCAIEDGRAAPVFVTIPLVLQDAVPVLRSALAGGDVTAVACGTDTVALAVLGACRILGLDVPGAVSVMGVDGSIEGRLVVPTLTSVSTDQSSVAAGIVDAFLAALDGSSDAGLVSAAPKVRIQDGQSA